MKLSLFFHCKKLPSFQIPESLVAREQEVRRKFEELDGVNLKQMADSIGKLTRDISQKLMEDGDWRGRFNLLSDALNEAVIGVLPNGTITLFNPAATSIFGWKEIEVLGRDLNEVLNTQFKYSDNFIDRVQEVVVNRNNGDALTMEVSFSKYSKESFECYYAVLRDITDRKRKEEEIEKKDSILNTLAYSASVLFKDGWETHIHEVLSSLAIASDADRCSIFKNHTSGSKVYTERIYSWEQNGKINELLTPNSFEITDESFAPIYSKLVNHECFTSTVDSLRDDVSSSLSKAGIHKMAVFPIIVNDTWWGNFCYDYVNPTKSWYQSEIDALTVVSGIFGAAIERDMADAQLIAKSKNINTLHQALDAASDVIMLTDFEDNIVFVNKAFEEKYEYTRDEVIGKKPSILKSGVHDESFYKNIKRKLLAGSSWYGRVINRTKGGKQIVNFTTVTPIMNGRPTPIYYLFVNKLDRRKGLPCLMQEQSAN